MKSMINGLGCGSYLGGCSAVLDGGAVPDCSVIPGGSLAQDLDNTNPDWYLELQQEYWGHVAATRKEQNRQPDEP